MGRVRAASLAPLLMLLLAPVAAADWPQAHADSAHGARGDAVLLPLRAWWDAPVNASADGGVVVVDGRVIAGGSDGKVRALDAVTGQLLWSYDAGSAVASTPAVSGGWVYAATLNGQLVALDAATGHLRPVAGKAVPDPGPVRAPLATHGGRLFAATEKGTVVAYNLGTLTSDWTYTPTKEVVVQSTTTGTGNQTKTITTCVPRGLTAAPIRSAPAVGAAGVFAGSDAHLLLALRESGLGADKAGLTNGLWPGADHSATCDESLLPQLNDTMRAAPVLDASENLVVVATFDGEVHAYDLTTGASAWSLALPNGSASGIAAAPLLTKGRVVVASFDGLVRAFDRNASLGPVWNASVGAPVWSSPVSDGSTMLVVDDLGVARALRLSDGRQLGTLDIGASVRAPLATANGAVYAVSVDGVLHAFGGPMPPLPDLRVELTVPDTVVEGKAWNVSVAIRNTGPAASPATQAVVRLDQLVLPAIAIPTLAPGASVASNLTASLGLGPHNVSVVLDPERAIRELRRDDNAARVPVLGIAAPKPNATKPLPTNDNATANVTGNATEKPPPVSKGMFGVPGPAPWMLAPAAGAALLLRRKR